MAVGASLPAARGSRYRLLALLYSSQFVPLAFFLYALPAVLRARGVPLEQIALLQLAALAWVAKCTWAPLVDRWGRYRTWLLAAQALMVVGVLALAPVDAGADFPVVVGVVAVVAVVSATQDIAADATAVRLLAPAERAVGNGIQKAGGYLGLLAGGGGVLVVYDRLGWIPALAVLAALTALPLPALLRYREPVAVAAVDRAPVSLRTVVGFFGQAGAPRWAFAVLALFLMGIMLSFPLLNPMLVDAGWSLEAIGVVSLVGGSTVALLTALGTGALLSVVGRRRALVVIAILQVAAVAALLVLAVGSGGTAAGLVAVALLSGSYAAAGTVVYTVSMDWCRPTSAGTDFTVQDSFVHLLSQLAGTAGLGIAGLLGYPVVLVGALLLAGLGAVAVATMFREQPAAA